MEGGEGVVAGGGPGSGEEVAGRRESGIGWGELIDV